MAREGLTNAQLATLAVAGLGGNEVGVHTEDAADAMYDLAPSRFCWRKHRERIDLHAVRVALADAMRGDTPLLAGGIRLGWMLTPAGLEWVRSRTAQVGQAVVYRRGTLDSWLSTERGRLRRTEAYRKWAGGDRAFTLRDFEDFARLNSYFPPKQRAERLSAVENAVASDPELLALWHALVGASTGTTP